MGNLFSVKQACEQVGLNAIITNSKKTILASSAVILPGVGAFGDAMQILEQLDLVQVIQELANSGKPVAGICLGMQLLMTESHEFGRHRGLGLIEGEVTRLSVDTHLDRPLKVPHMGWSRIYSADSIDEQVPVGAWKGSLIEDLPNGTFMYFVHSYYPKPESPDVRLSLTRYGSLEFCSSFQKRNIFGCQFHPERSGPRGLAIYRKLAASIHSLQEQHSYD